LSCASNGRFAPEGAVPSQSDIERNEVSPAHAHPDLDQTAYILEDEAIAEIGGEEHHVRGGDLLYFPARVFHSIKVLSERVKPLVIYSPPYGENPAKLIKSREQ
jgi:Mannose-6-phosphate isomerase